MEFVFRNIAKEPPTEKELRQLAERGGVELARLVNTKSQGYKKLKPDLAVMGEAEIVNLLQANPTIMVRPIVTDGQTVVFGFKENEYQMFVTSSQS
ncbi:arsenate reductase [Sporolituus thermophilus DSM 23256]|uniref:Arsenate reductase n=1 Tax=Sporolituus thermophilus DSM 23256 TaxID=1123285 RepID=A0A1G7NZI0_9FIRM|nr:arsenate reductase [Sporolituus thermophilus DSM 23256]